MARSRGAARSEPREQSEEAVGGNGATMRPTGNGGPVELEQGSDVDPYPANGGGAVGLMRAEEETQKGLRKRVPQKATGRMQATETRGQDVAGSTATTAEAQDGIAEDPAAMTVSGGAAEGTVGNE